MVQDTLEAAADEQSAANGYVQDCETADGLPFQLAAAPVQFGRRRRPGGRPSSTSTATPSSPTSASTGTRSWT